jgi:glycosyltransferase involved in cell wall biosynthesis
MKNASTVPNILQLITNLGPGGAQRAFYDHGLFLREKYNVIEAVYDKDEFPNLFESPNPLYSLDVKGKGGLINKITNFRRRYVRLRKLTDEKNIDLCISHMDGANWVNVLSGSKAKKILFVQGTVLHDHALNTWIQKLRKNFLIPYLYNKADVTVAVSDGIRHELQKYCNVKKVVTIPNFFDISLIQNKVGVELNADEQKLFSDHIVLITSGRFHEQKKQRHLFPVFKNVRKKYPDAKLVLLGDGELRDELIGEAMSLGFNCFTVWNKEQRFSENFDVFFLGYKDNPFQYLHRSTLFLFPSGWEGFPLALCEAMISGVSVLAADCPTGPREIIAPGTFDAEYKLEEIQQTDFGTLLPMTDKKTFVAAWSQAIEDLLKNEPLRQRQILHASERVKEFDKSVAIQKWIKVIDNVLAGSSFDTV